MSVAAVFAMALPTCLNKWTRNSDDPICQVAHSEGNLIDGGSNFQDFPSSPLFFLFAPRIVVFKCRYCERSILYSK